jgi:hypothetical protein
MPFRPMVLISVVAMSTLTLVQSASAQTYPTKPIHLIVPYPAGGGQWSSPLAAPDAARRVVTALGYIPPIPTEDLNPAHPPGRGSHM